MGLSNTQYRDIMYKYDQLRLKNKRLVASRYEKLYEKIPELRNIQNEIINLSTNQARMELLNPDEKLDEKAYRAKKDELINKKTELLLANGYPADFLSPIYSCKDCKDTGYIDNKPCHCTDAYGQRTKAYPCCVCSAGAVYDGRRHPGACSWRSPVSHQ